MTIFNRVWSPCSPGFHASFASVEIVDVPAEGCSEISVVPCVGDVNTQLYGLVSLGADKQRFLQLQTEFIEDEAASQREVFEASEMLFYQGQLRRQEVKLLNCGVLEIAEHRFGLDEMEAVLLDKYTTYYQALVEETGPVARVPDYLLDNLVHCTLLQAQFGALLVQNGRELFSQQALDFLEASKQVSAARSWDCFLALEIHRWCILFAFDTPDDKAAFMTRFRFLRRAIGIAKDPAFYDLPDVPPIPPLNKLFTTNPLRVNTTVHAALPRATLPIYTCFELRHRNRSRIALVEPAPADPANFQLTPGLERAGHKILTVSGSFSCVMAGDEGEEVIQVGQNVTQTLRKIKLKLFLDWEWIDGAAIEQSPNGSLEIRVRRARIPLQDPVCFLKHGSAFLCLSGGTQPFLLKAKTPSDAATVSYLVNKHADLLFD